MYVYQADVFCDDCVRPILGNLPKPNYPRPWDTDDYPLHIEDSGSADSPQHCGSCGCPLEYSLTAEGIAYVIDRIHESLNDAIAKGRVETWDRIMPKRGTGEETKNYWYGRRHVEILRGWAEDLRDNYSLGLNEQWLVALFLELSEPLKT